MFGKDFSNISTSKIDDTLGLRLNDAQVTLSSQVKDHLGLNLGDLLLAMSVCWSFKTGISSFLKIHSEQKAGMLCVASKLVLGLRALAFSVTRITCIVAFFAPFLGLADILAHYHAEDIQISPELLEKLQGNASYWEITTVELMYRPWQEQATNYTLVSLQAAFFIFFAVLLLHAIAVFILKSVLSVHFKETGWMNKIGHVVESLHVPDVYKDFDVDLNPEEEKTPKIYKTAHRYVLKETLCMTFVQMVSNILLLLPLFYTGEMLVHYSSF